MARQGCPGAAVGSSSRPVVAPLVKRSVSEVAGKCTSSQPCMSLVLYAASGTSGGMLRSCKHTS